MEDKSRLKELKRQMKLDKKARRRAAEGMDEEEGGVAVTLGRGSDSEDDDEDDEMSRWVARVAYQVPLHVTACHRMSLHSCCIYIPCCKVCRTLCALNAGAAPVCIWNYEC